MKLTIQETRTIRELTGTDRDVPITVTRGDYPPCHCRQPPRLVTATGRTVRNPRAYSRRAPIMQTQGVNEVMVGEDWIMKRRNQQ